MVFAVAFFKNLNVPCLEFFFNLFAKKIDERRGRGHGLKDF